ncbi:MAG: hypothetical protein MN733_16100 [Nitrososphaera sp.]|nr:hypothetical protein [Nitrososphaera sp.]
MQVKLAQNWFGPDGRRYRKNTSGDMLTFIPDVLKKFLPSSAVVVIVEDGLEFKPVIQDRAVTLRAFDQDRQVSDAEESLAQKAENNRAAELAKGELLRKRQEQAARMRAAKAAKKSAAV